MGLPLAARFELTPAPGVGAGGGAAASSKSAQSLSRAFRPAPARSWYGHAVRGGTSFPRLEGAQGAQRGQAALRPRYVQRRREAGTTQPASTRVSTGCRPATRSASASSSPPLDAASGGGTRRAVGRGCTGCARHRQLSKHSTAAGGRSIPRRASGTERAVVAVRATLIRTRCRSAVDAMKRGTAS